MGVNGCPICAKIVYDRLVRAVVFDALDAAVENGYQVTDPVQEARDLQYDGDLDGIKPEELEPHVRAWLRAREEIART